MDRLTDLLEQLRVNMIAQLTAKTRGEVAALALKRRGLDAEVKKLVELLGDDARWEVAGYEAWADDLMGLLLKARSPQKRRAA